MPEGEPTSPTLLERARSSDQQAWSRLVFLYEPLVRRWCGRWGLLGPDADDLAQEIFIGMASGLATFRRDRPGDSFRGWLYGIARNKHTDFLRRRGRGPVAQGGTEAGLQLGQVLDPDSNTPDDPIEEMSGLYQRALALIRQDFEERSWQIFHRLAVDGQSVDVVAAEFGSSSAAVRKVKSRVLRRLKEEVGDLIA